MAENKLNDIIKTSLESIKSIIDVNTIIGDPIPTPNGTTIIPVSKVSMGFASGGLDYIGKHENSATEKKANFGGGGGTGVTVSPIGFLVISADGNVQLLNISNPANATSGTDFAGSIGSIIEKSPDIIQKIKDIFSKNKSDKVDKVENEEIQNDIPTDA